MVNTNRTGFAEAGTADQEITVHLPDAVEEPENVSKSKRGLAASYCRLYKGTPWYTMTLAILAAVAAGVPLPVMSYITGMRLS
jgi:hypothetical protein